MYLYSIKYFSLVFKKRKDKYTKIETNGHRQRKLKNTKRQTTVYTRQH